MTVCEGERVGCRFHRSGASSVEHSVRYHKEIKDVAKVCDPAFCVFERLRRTVVLRLVPMSRTAMRDVQSQQLPQPTLIHGTLTAYV